MAWEVEVTFYRELERTENLVSYLPCKQNQTFQYRVLFSQYYKQKLYFCKGRGLLSQSRATGWTNCRGRSGHGCMKDHHGKVWMSQWSQPSACICPSFRGLRALLVPITVPLESAQACFNFWKPRCVSASSRKEQTIAITAQGASVFRNFSARGESAEDWRLVWTLLCLRLPLLHCLSDCLSHVKVYVQRLLPSGALYLSLCAICSSGVDFLLRLTTFDHSSPGKVSEQWPPC